MKYCQRQVAVGILEDTNIVVSFSVPELSAGFLGGYILHIAREGVSNFKDVGETLPLAFIAFGTLLDVSLSNDEGIRNAEWGEKQEQEAIEYVEIVYSLGALYN